MMNLSPDVLTSQRFDAQAQQLKSQSLDQKKEMSDKEMHDVADKFEAMILRQMLKEMRKSVPKEDGFFGDSHAMNMYMDMSDDNLAKSLAENSSFGLDESIYNELKEKNDRLANPEDVESKFHKLKNRNDQGFMPLASTEHFLSLNRSQDPKMIPLPEKKEDFTPLGSHRRLSTAKIEQN
ncbi:rod-binding protein [bacterium]|nr:rod-binding protein [bacterium]